jgi:hypothetical protein
MKNLLTTAFIGTCLMARTVQAMEIAAPALERNVLTSSEPDLGKRGWDLQTAEMKFTNVPPHLQNKSSEELRLLAAESLLAMQYQNNKITLDMSKYALLQTAPATRASRDNILVKTLALTAAVGVGYFIALKTKSGE